MTVTETPPEVASEQVEAQSSIDDRPIAPQGLAAVIGSGDHKVIGRLYIGFSMLFGLAALVGRLISSVDRIDGLLGNDVVDAGSWYQVATFSSTAVVFLFLLPLIIGVAVCVVPLQLGATAIAFPRAAAASFWGWLLGSGTFVGAYAINGGPAGGDSEGVGLWAISFGMLVLSLLLAAVCLVTTVFAYRSDGMTLDRVPMFSWSILVAGVIWILTLPVLIATLVLIYVDHRYGQTSFGVNGPEMYNSLSWVLRQPQVYALAIPLLGVAGDVIPVAAGRRQPQRQVVMAAIGAFGVLSFGAYLQPTIYPEATTQPLYIAMAILAVLPVLAALGAWASTARGGKPRLLTPLPFAAFGVLALLLATLLGAVGAIETFDLQGTLYEVGQSDLVTYASATAVIGALFYWGAKITGRNLPGGLGSLIGLVLVLGTLLASIPNIVSGAFADGDEVRAGIEGLNAAVAAGQGLMLGGLLLTIAALLAASRGDKADDDPWAGQTLEWATASPPSATNFEELHHVTSPEPLLDAATEEASA